MAEETLYYQKCPQCGALHTIPDPEHPVKKCEKCFKTRIAKIPPLPYREAEDKRQTEGIPRTEGENREQSEPEVADGFLAIRKNIESEIDTRESTGWEEVLGTSGGTTPAPTGGNALPGRLTFSACNHGTLTFTLDPETESSAVLGRSALQSEFLAKDLRVGNEHCTVFVRNGAWYVKDHSQNGTFVNGKDIGEGGEHILADGARLTLGHHEDSVAFMVRII